MPPKVSIFTNERKSIKKSLSHILADRSETIVTEADKENAEPNDGLAHAAEPPSPLDFAEFFPWTCHQLGVDGDVVVIKKVQEKIVKKSKKVVGLIDGESKSVKSQSIELMRSKSVWNATACARRRVVHVHAACDARGRPLALRVAACDLLTQLHLKVLQLCLPFQPTLSNIVLTKCKLSQEVLYELGQLLKRSLITELILDDTLCKQGNFYAVLDYDNSLQRLSLNRCNINDTIVIELFKRVKAPLQILELSGNFITNNSIRKVAKVLRTNRSLIHLNLAGNSIDDDAVSRIMDTLKRFELTKEEILGMRIRKGNYYKNRKSCFEEQLRLAETRAAAGAGAGRRNVRAPSARSLVAVRKGDSASAAAVAERMTRQLMGACFTDVFDEEHVQIEDGKMFCLGNFKLGSVNFAYNDLSHIGMEKILNVLEYQKPPLVSGSAGLVRIVVNGNNLCENCDVQQRISIHINRKLSGIIVKPHKDCRLPGDVMHSIL